MTVCAPASFHRARSCAKPWNARPDLHALAAGVGEPLRQRNRADLRDLVERHQQRRVQPAAGHPRAELHRAVLDLASQRREQRGQGAVVAVAAGEHVERPAGQQELVDVERLPRRGQRRGRRAPGRSGTPLRADMTIRTVAAVFSAGPVQLGELVRPSRRDRRCCQDRDRVGDFVAVRPTGRPAACPGRSARRRRRCPACRRWPCRPRRWRPRRRRSTGGLAERVGRGGSRSRAPGSPPAGTSGHCSGCRRCPAD